MVPGHPLKPVPKCMQKLFKAQDCSKQEATLPSSTSLLTHLGQPICVSTINPAKIAAVHELLPFTATPALGVMMLNDFQTYLMETDVTKLTWAQYMEVDMHSNGTGLLDYWGNARPSWHTFRFWGDLPIERMVSPPNE